MSAADPMGGAVDPGWLDELVAAWRGHVEAGAPEGGPAAVRLLACFAEGGVWEDVAAQAVYRGHTELRQMFEQSYQWSPTLAFDVVRARGGTDHYVIEWEMHAAGNGAFGDLPASDRPFRVRGVSVGEVGPDGRVTAHRDYWDRHVWLEQVGLAVGS